MVKALLPGISKSKKGLHHIVNSKGNNLRNISIYRYDGGESNLRIDTFVMNVDQKETILNVIDRIKEEADPSLSYRKSCREGSCGSCAMNINKQNSLACTTKVSDIKGHIDIYPLPHMNVVKDLVCDMSHFFNQYKSIKPWLIGEAENIDNHNGEENKKKSENIQTKEQRAKLDGLYECILCACCSTQCPSYWWNTDKFLGPAILLQLFRLVQDSRDKAKEERLKTAKKIGGLNNCHKIFACTKVCPKKLNPANVIQKLTNIIK